MCELEIIHENKDFIVINKEAGRISEKNPYEFNTAEDQVFDHLLKQHPKPFVGVIHRLDRVTSGVLIFAKKKSVLKKFNALFSQGKIQKTYLAIVKNKPLKDQGTLVDFLVKNQLEKRADVAIATTKHALECNLSYDLVAKNKHGYLLEIKPKTGRFHQIRAQLANMGCPIIGDEKYGSDEAYLPLSICLHASELRYPIFDSKKFQTFKATYPANDFFSLEV